jgi:alpha-galactosidase
MKKFKIVFIGGASMTWIPKFVRDLLLLDGVDGSEISLMDIDLEHLEVMGRLVERMIRESGKGYRVSLYDNRRQALAQADIVVSTCLIGGHETWKNDLNIILKYGIQHPKGMSVGPGGLIQGLKNIPPIVGFAREMEEICPEAWLLNYTNPMQSITLGLALHAKIKSIGLCHGVDEGIRNVADFLEMNGNSLISRAFGINHCGWLLELKKGGEDVMPDLRRKLEALAPSLKGRWEGQEIVTREIWDVFGGLPLTADIHAIEFFPHYIAQGVKLETYSLEHNFIERRLENREKLWKRVRLAADGEIPTLQAIGNTANPNDTNYASPEKLDELVKAFIAHEPASMYINTLNRGYISNLPSDCCVEVPGMVRDSGATGEVMGPLPDGIAGLMLPHAYIQKLTVLAAMEGSRELALQALCLEPMCHSLRISEVRAMLEELLESQPEWLPHFFNQ